MEVIHPRYGRGVVTHERHAGLEYLVAFYNGRAEWCRREELDGLTAPESSLASQPSSHIMANPPKERALIEALRLGIVPDAHTEDFIFGRDDEIRQIKDLLNGSDSSLMIVGDYGAGKTHLLDYTYHMALRDGYAVARTDIDPNENPFHRPKYVYRKLISSFRFKRVSGEIAGFRRFMIDVANMNPGILQSHEYLGELIDWMNNGYFYGSDWEWIEGEDSNIKPRLYDNAPAANIYCNILSGIGWAASQGLGMKGFLLLFDEAEILNSTLSYTYQRESGDNFLKGLLMTVQSDSSLLADHKMRRSDGGIYGTVSGLRYPVHASHITYLYRQPSFLKMIMTFTPIPELYGGGREIWRILNNEPSMRILSPDLAALREALVHVCSLYEKAYGFTLSDSGQSKVTEIIYNHDYLRSSTRRFVKASIEALDILRFHSSR